MFIPQSKDTIHENVYFIHNYQQDSIKNIVRGSKKLDNNCMQTIAADIHTWILERSTPTTSPSCTPSPVYAQNRLNQNKIQPNKILLLHSPSTTFAQGKRPSDQLAVICQKVSELEIAGQLEFGHIPHLFLIKRQNRSAQHDKSKTERILSTENRFTIQYGSRKRFIRLLQKYNTVYIIDDVVTTGSTLSELHRLIFDLIQCIPNPPEVVCLAFSH